MNESQCYTKGDWIQESWDGVILPLLGSDPRHNGFVYGHLLITFGAYWIFGGLFSYVDLTGKPTFMAKYKIQQNVKAYPISIGEFTDLVNVVVVNQILVIPLLWIGFQIDQWRPICSIGEIPSLQTAIFHLLFFILVIEILFYYAHRILHHPLIYKRIHKKHHTWISPVAISAIYCHPIEQIVSNIIPTVAGPMILGSHLLISWIWLTVAVFTTLVTHSGYHLPFFPSAEAHDFHHLKFNYNFGVIGLLDRIHGTDGLFRFAKEGRRHRTLWSLVPAKKLIP